MNEPEVSVPSTQVKDGENDPEDVVVVSHSKYFEPINHVNIRFWTETKCVRYRSTNSGTKDDT